MEERQTNQNQRRKLLAVLTPLGLGGLLLAALWTSALALSGTVSPIYTQSNEDGLPDIATNASGDYVALVWSRGRDSTSGPAGYVYLDIASEATGKWQIPMRVYPASATGSNSAREARITFDPQVTSTLHMVWNQKTASGFSQILYASCYVTNTSTCAASAIVARTVVDNASTLPNQPDIAVDEAGRRHVVWVTTGSSAQVQYSCSSDGSSWSSPIPVVPSLGITVTQPSIAYAGGLVHVVWAEGTGSDFTRIGYASRSASICAGVGLFSGVTFAAGGSNQARDPKVAAIGNTVYVVWDVNTGLGYDHVITYYLVYNRSLTGGSSWADPKYLDITTADVTPTERPVFNYRVVDPSYSYFERLHPDVTLEVTGSYTVAHVVWQESTLYEDVGALEGYFDIFYTSYNGTGTWIAPINVTTGTKTASPIYSVMPSVAVGQNGRVHIAYMQEQHEGPDSPEEWDLYYYGLLVGPPQSGGVYLPVILKNSS